MTLDRSLSLERPRIALRINDRESSIFELVLQAFAQEFCAKGSAYFQAKQIEEFLSALRAMPLGEPGPSISGGHFGDSGKTLIRELLYMSVCQVTKTGLLAMNIRVFVPDYRFEPNGFGIGGRCTLFLDYSGLTRFNDQFGSLLCGDVSSVEFDGFIVD